MGGQLTYIGGLLLRIGLPLLLTLLAGWALRRWDERWRSQGGIAANMRMAARSVRCWVLNDCPESRRQSCPVFLERAVPCWQHFRDQDGRLAERCLECDVFRHAPIPVLAGRSQ